MLLVRPRIYSNTRQAKTTLIPTEELQPWDLPMTNFKCLLQHKGAPIFQLKQPLFLEKDTKLRLPFLVAKSTSWLVKRRPWARCRSSGTAIHELSDDEAFSREGHFDVFLPKKWLFGLKNCGSFVLQEMRNNGQVRVPRL